MQSRLMLIGACVLAGVVALSAQRTGGPGARAGGTPQQNQELIQARQQLQHDQAESKRLQDLVKADRKSGDQAALTKDTQALQSARDAVKHDQDKIRQLQNEQRAARGGRQGRRGGN